MIRCRDRATHPLRLPNTPVRNELIWGRSNGLTNWPALVDIVRAAVTGETAHVPNVWAGGGVGTRVRFQDVVLH